MKNWIIVLCLFVFLPFSIFAQKDYVVTKPPVKLELDAFYKKYVDASGIPVVSSWRVHDEALIKVAQMTTFFFDNLPKEVATNLLNNKAALVFLPAMKEQRTCRNMHIW